jgi:hypothetical protein
MSNRTVEFAHTHAYIHTYIHTFTQKMIFISAVECNENYNIFLWALSLIPNSNILALLKIKNIWSWANVDI